jgi:hypothetical protein
MQSSGVGALEAKGRDLGQHMTLVGQQRDIAREHLGVRPVSLVEPGVDPGGGDGVMSAGEGEGGELEGQQEPVCGQLPCGQHECLDGGVEQGRVQAVGLSEQVLRQLNARDSLPLAEPQGGNALEEGAIVDACLRELDVELRNGGERLAASHDLGQVRRRLRGRVGGGLHVPCSVDGPRLVRGSVRGAAADSELGAVGSSVGEQDLNPARGGVMEQQGGLEQQGRELERAGCVLMGKGGGASELDDGGGGQDDLSEDPVVGEVGQ